MADPYPPSQNTRKLQSHKEDLKALERFLWDYGYLIEYSPYDGTAKLEPITERHRRHLTRP